MSNRILIPTSCVFAFGDPWKRIPAFRKFSRLVFFLVTLGIQRKVVQQIANQLRDARNAHVRLNWEVMTPVFAY